MLFLALLLIQVIVFAFLVFFLKAVLARNIASATTHLDEMNRDYMQKIEDAKKRLAEADKYYQETAARAGAEAEKTKADILKEAQESRDLMIKEARKQSEDIIQQAHKAKELLLKELDHKIEEKAGQKACQMVQELLPEEISKEMHQHWVGELLKHGLDQLDRLNLPAEVAEAEVASAFPLTAEHRAALSKKMKEKLGKELKLREEVSPGLIAGFRVKLASIVIDGSLNFKIKEWARHA